MGNAVDILQEMIRQRDARNQKTIDAISGGIDKFGENRLKMRALEQKERASQLDHILTQSKIDKNLLDAENSRMQSQFLNAFLHGNDPTNEGGVDPLVTSMTVNGMTISNPKAKAEEAATIAAAKPLSGDTARMFSGAKQGLGNIKKIAEEFELSQDADGNVVAKDFESLRKKLQNERFAQKVGIGNPSSAVNIVSGGSADFFAKISGLTSKEGRNLALLFSTLAENNLRARTGAQAPEPEKVAEELRTILSGVDDVNGLFNKLNESAAFLEETASQIRPRQKLPKFKLKSSKSVDKSKLPPKGSAPKGAKGWDTEKGEWVF